MQLIAPQPGSAFGLRGNGKNWSILYRLHSGKSPSLNWGWPFAEFNPADLLAPLTVQDSGRIGGARLSMDKLMVRMADAVRVRSSYGAEPVQETIQ
jgi:hypothetical protein